MSILDGPRKCRIQSLANVTWGLGDVDFETPEKRKACEFNIIEGPRVPKWTPRNVRKM